jgi:hypothetical protein
MDGRRLSGDGLNPQWFLVGAVAAALKSPEALEATIPNKEKQTKWQTSTHSLKNSASSPFWKLPIS